MANRFINSGPLSLDTNLLNDFTDTVVVPEGATLSTFFVVGKTGSHSTHEVTLQISPNGTNWFDTSKTLVGLGPKSPFDCICINVRVKVTIAEGSASTCDIYIVAS